MNKCVCCHGDGHLYLWRWDYSDLYMSLHATGPELEQNPGGCGFDLLMPKKREKLVAEAEAEAEAAVMSCQWFYCEGSEV